MSSPVSMNEGALEEMATILREARRRGLQALDEAQRKSTQVRGAVLNAISDREQTLRAAQAVLEACERSEAPSCSRERIRVERAEVRLATARAALRQVDEADTNFRQARLRHSAALAETVSRGRVRLSELAGRLRDYSAVMAASSGPNGSVGVHGVGPRPSGGFHKADSRVSTAQGMPAGFAMVPLSDIDTASSTVTSSADFGKGYSPEDLDWAFGALEEVVLPTLASGGTRDDLVARDQRTGRMGTRSYAMTHSQFFGRGDAIVLERGGGPGLLIVNGQHRIWVAQHFGRTHVPARIIGSGAA